jgi:hypothetical protein
MSAPQATFLDYVQADGRHKWSRGDYRHSATAKGVEEAGAVR